ncbi:MAG TPA: hypothetical protein VGA37_06010 [Gemmatimonadales bacterium]
MTTQPLEQFFVAHVGDLCAEPGASLAHALNAIDCLGSGFTHRLGPSEIEERIVRAFEKFNREQGNQPR